jgi:hypothetical protein
MNNYLAITMNLSVKLRIGILLAVGLPSIFGLGLVGANQFNLFSLPADSRIIQPVNIDGSAFHTASREFFEFLRVELQSENDLLLIEVSFSGSEEEHHFELIGAGDFMESIPIQTSLVLSHESNHTVGEVEMVVTKKLSFDLNPLKEAFFKLYSFFSPENISLQLNLEGYGELLYSL